MTTSYKYDCLLLTFCFPLPALVFLCDWQTVCPLTNREFAGINKQFWELLWLERRYKNLRYSTFTIRLEMIFPSQWLQISKSHVHHVKEEEKGDRVCVNLLQLQEKEPVFAIVCVPMNSCICLQEQVLKKLTEGGMNVIKSMCYFQEQISTN